MIKAAFFDIDGTLVSLKTKVYPRSLPPAIAALREKGIRCFVATGRSKFEIAEERLLEGMEFDGILTNNGQDAYTPEGELLYGTPVDPRDVHTAYKWARDNNIVCWMVSGSRSLMSHADPVTEKTMEAIHTKLPPLGALEPMLEEPVYKVVLFTTKEKLSELLPRVPHSRTTLWHETGQDIISLSGGKKLCMLECLKRLHLDPSEVIAFGDSENDIEMLQAAGIGVAMDNGTPECKAAADYIAPDCDEDGILRALRHFGLLPQSEALTPSLYKGEPTMNKEWDLSPLYTGFHDPAYLRDLEALKAAVEEIRTIPGLQGAMEPTDYLVKALGLEEKVTELGGKMAAYAALRSAANARDGEAVSALGHLRQLFSQCSAPTASLQSYIGRLENLEDLIASHPFLGQYAYLLRMRKADAAYTLEDRVEEVLAKMDLSGGSAWSNLQEYLTSTVTAQYRGEAVNLSTVRNLAYDKDPAVRKDAYDAEIACYDKIKDSVAFALNNLKTQVNTECDLRKGGSPLEMTLRQSRMEKSTLDAMITAIEEYLPVFWKYLKAKAKALGYEGGLKWWDLFAPMGENTATYTVEEARTYLIDHFRTFAPDMADMIARAFDEGWIDFYPRDGKRGGAFCYNLASIGQSRVLTNFDGAFGDIVTLAHELGHAYHGQQIEDHAPLNLDYSMPVAETASTFNETVIMNAALAETGDPKVKMGLLESQLQDTTQIMCDIMSRYWFETAVFEQSREGFLFPDTLCKLMHEAQLRGYGDGVDPDTLHPYMWVCKSHYYSSHLSFYNFPYAFGGLFAAGLYAQYLREGEAFLPKYRALLKATTVSTVEEVAKMADIDLSDVNFWRSSLEIFKARVEDFIALSQQA